MTAPGGDLGAGGVRGIGVDAVDVERFRRVIERRPGIVDRLFTETERAYAGAQSRPRAPPGGALRRQGGGAQGPRRRCGRGRRSATSRWSGATTAAPGLALSGRAAALSVDRGVRRWHVSLTHTDTVAVATVVAEGPATRAAPGPAGRGAVKPVLRVEEMRAVDADALESVSEQTLVERAGTAVATWAVRMLGGTYGRHVVVVAGKGNNGADGRVAAARLRRRGARVTVVDAGDAPERIGPVGAVDLVIDAAYGTGFRGTYRAPAVPPGVPVLAVDIPSGVNGDTGEACGEPLRADVTVTFAALKTGLVQGDGALLAGRVEVADIGLDVEPGRHVGGRGRRRGPAAARRGPATPHKWQSAVAVVAGSPGMTGAAGLCARAAYRAGAGMVRLGIPGGDPADLPVSEAVGAALPAEGWAGRRARHGRSAAGPWWSAPGSAAPTPPSPTCASLVARPPLPVVVDADGLYALGTGRRDRRRACAGRAGRRPRAGVVLTPHDGEFARLAGGPPGADRIAAARRLGAALRRRGAAQGTDHGGRRPGGEVLLATAGSPRLATAGTGDVLSGVIGAFLARGVEPHQAAALAAHVHGRAAELGPPEGLVAGDLAELVGRWLSGSGGEPAAVRRRRGAPAAWGRARCGPRSTSGAVRHNAALLRRLVAPAALCAVVKADGYGHGAVPVAAGRARGGRHVVGGGHARGGRGAARRRHRRAGARAVGAAARRPWPTSWAAA